MKKIKFVDANSYSRGGAVKSMVHLASWLSEKNEIDVCVFSPETKVIRGLSLNNKVKFISTGEIDISRSSLDSNFSRFFKILRYWKKSYSSIDWSGSLICFNEPKSVIYYLPHLLLNRNRCIYYVRINERIKFLNVFIAIVFPKILLISSSSRKAFRPYLLDFFKNKFEVLNTGFDVDVAGDNLKPNLNLCYVASLCERKNQKFLVKVMEQVVEKFPDCKLCFYGESPLGFELYKGELLDLIESTGLSDKVVLKGYSDNIANVLSDFDIFLMPSFLEGLPRVVIEALFSGLYVVSVPTDGVEDIIKNEELGVVTNSYDVNEFSKCLISKLDYIKANPGKEKLNRNYRREFAREQFGKEKFVNGFLDVIDRI